MDSIVFYPLKNLTNNSIISISKASFKIGRASSNVAFGLPSSIERYFDQYESVSLLLSFYIVIQKRSTLSVRFQFERNVDPSNTKSSKERRCESKCATTNSTDVFFQRVELHSGEVLHLVFRKDLPESSRCVADLVLQIDLPKSNPFDVGQCFPSIPPTSSESKVNEFPRSLYRSSLRRKNASEDMEDILTCVCCQDIMSNSFDR